VATTVKEMLAAANAAVPRLEPGRVPAMVRDEDALVVDVREPGELRQGGKLKGAVNVPRGLVEFKADPEGAARDPAFRQDRPVLVYCASGGRSALAGKALKELGYERVYNLGGFKELAEAGLETEPS
jgi:rhodanese-related sulfurtransferase